MNIFKKTQNCLFVEEETYNWSAPKTGINKKLIGLGIMFMLAALMFSALR